MALPWMAAKILLRPVAELRAHPGNARLHGAEQLEQIKASMLAFGFTNPLLVDADGVLIAGHGRLAAAVSLGIEKVPVIVLRHLSAAQKEALRLADNRITRHKARGIETEHPAVFPVALPEFLLRTYADEGDIVVEPFAGAGTSLLAGQRTGRRVAAIELAPAYVDLAIARWRLLNPDLPVTLDGDGRDYGAVAAERTEVAYAA